MASSSNFIFLFLIILCLWTTTPLVRCGSKDLNQPDCLRVPVSELVASVKSAIDIVEKTTSFLSQFITNVSGDFRVSNALSQCLDLLDLSAEELQWTLQVSLNPYGTNVSTGDVSSDLRTWLSGVLVNQDTCIDGFGRKNDNVKTLVAEKLKIITSLVTKTLRMVKPFSSHSADSKGGRDEYIPSWIQNKQNKLIRASKVSADFVVALDGTEKFTSINDAVNAVPDRSSEPFIIYVKRGVYKEYVQIKKDKWNIMMIGDGIDATVISGSRNSVDGVKTFYSATFSVMGRGFIAKDMTIENTAGPEKQQAVAFISVADLTVLYRCSVRSYQDTLYAQNNRHFYKDCLIKGSLDFIFGRASAVFQNCQIVVRKGLPNQKYTITAQGRRKSLEQTSGFSIQFCNITAEPDVGASLAYLGRPWKMYSTTVIMKSNLSSAISPKGWLEWDGNFALDTLYYGEYMNYGPGADLSNRVNWTGFHVIKDEAVANKFTVAELIAGDSWLPSTGIEYIKGLDP